MSNLWVTAAQGDKATWIEPSGEHEIDTDTYPIRTGRVQDLRPGDLARPDWQGHMPFRRIRERSFHDPSHPSDTSGDPEEAFPTRMFVPVYHWGYGPHVPEDARFHVVRGHP